MTREDHARGSCCSMCSSPRQIRARGHIRRDYRGTLPHAHRLHAQRNGGRHGSHRANRGVRHRHLARWLEQDPGIAATLMGFHRAASSSSTAKTSSPSIQARPPSVRGERGRTTSSIPPESTRRSSSARSYFAATVSNREARSGIACPRRRGSRRHTTCVAPRDVRTPAPTLQERRALPVRRARSRSRARVRRIRHSAGRSDGRRSSARWPANHVSGGGP